jgi:hypothetical protein
MGYRPCVAFEVSTRTSKGTSSILEEPLGLTPSVGLWPGQTGPFSNRVIGARVFSGTTLSAGVTCPNAYYDHFNVSTTDTRPGHRRQSIGRAYRSTRA